MLDGAALREPTAAVDGIVALAAGAQGGGYADLRPQDRMDGVWQPVVDALGLTEDVVATAAARAERHGTSFQAELFATGTIGEVAFFRQVAATLGVPFLGEFDPDALVMRDRDGLVVLRSPEGARMARLQPPAGPPLILVAPRAQEFARLKDLLIRNPKAAARLRIVTPSALRQALQTRCRPLLLRNATSQLSEKLPHCSSRTVVTGWQGFLAGSLLGAAVLLVAMAPMAAFVGWHLFFSVFFLACVILRLVAIRRVPPRATAVAVLQPGEMPRYSILVALYREAEIVPELLVALGKLVWPRALLEIKLVCEADDRATIDAIRAHDLRSLVEIIEVPASFPRTKPKALAYALQMVSGEIVGLYDAEDRPHPMQLVEAWRYFRSADDTLACVQAPLQITNMRHSMLSRMFGFEYSGLFKGMLPFLSRNDLVLPLGGTSNHFNSLMYQRHQAERGSLTWRLHKGPLSLHGA